MTRYGRGGFDGADGWAGRRRGRARGRAPAGLDRRGRGDPRVVRAAGHRPSGCECSATPPATYGPVPMPIRRGGGSARTWTACGAAASSTGRSGWPAGSRSRRAARRKIAVLSFADEEGARFNTPTFGSKALAGRLDLPAVLERRDDDGVASAEAMRAAGVDPDGIDRAPEWLARSWPGSSRSTSTRRPSWRGPASRSAWSARWPRAPGSRCVLTGRADHAGTTPRSERRDALSAAARLIVGAEDAAGAGSPLDGDRGPLTITASRIIAKPNAPTTIASEVRLWIDARAPAFDAIDAWRARLDALVGELRERTGVEIDIAVASRSDAASSTSRLRAALSRAAEDVLGHAAARPALLRRSRCRRARRARAGGHAVRAQPDRGQPLAGGDGRRSTTPRWPRGRGAGAGRGWRDRARVDPGHAERTLPRLPARACAGRAERPGGARDDDFWTWRTEMFAPGRGARSRVDARGGAGDLRRDGRRRLRRGGRVSLRPPPARRDAVPRARTRWRSRSPRRRVEAGLRDRAASGRVSPRRVGTARTCRRRPVNGASATRMSRRSWPAWRRCASGRPACRASRWGSPRTACGRSRAAGSRRSRRIRTVTGWSGTCTRPSSGVSSPSARPSTAARRSSCSSAPGSWGSGRA